MFRLLITVSQLECSWSGVFSLNGDLRFSLAAPEVEEEGGDGVSVQVSQPAL